MAHYVKQNLIKGTSFIDSTKLIALDGRDIEMRQGYSTPIGIYTVSVHTQVVEPTVLYAGSAVFATEYLDWLMGEMQECIKGHKAFIRDTDMPERCRKYRYNGFQEYVENVLPKLDPGIEPEEEANFDF